MKPKCRRADLHSLFLGGACGSRRRYPSTGSWGAPESPWRLWCDGGDLRARPNHGATFSGEAFAKLYGLTGSELRVLLAVAPGLSVKVAAEILGISDTTAKTHLQHIYAKTNTSKQTQLMHLFMSSTPPVKAE